MQSGNESNMELWILSRLAYAIDQCNSGFEGYDFAVATTAIYNFWLYDLCDVYLVSSFVSFANKNYPLIKMKLLIYRNA